MGAHSCLMSTRSAYGKIESLPSTKTDHGNITDMSALELRAYIASKFTCSNKVANRAFIYYQNPEREAKPEWQSHGSTEASAIGGKEIRWPRPRVGADKGVHTGERLSGRAYFFHQRPSSLSGALSTPSTSPILPIISSNESSSRTALYQSPLIPRRLIRRIHHDQLLYPGHRCPGRNPIPRHPALPATSS